MRRDNKHCVRCGEPTNTEFCLECEKSEYWAYLQEIGE